MKELLIKLKACEEARDWASDKTIEEVVKQCHRGDWLLWLASKVDIGLKPLMLAKGHCANTVRHLMKDERSIIAVDTAIAFGEGRATLEELNAKDADARAAADATSYAAYTARAAADAARAAAYDDAYAAYAAYAYAAAAYAADAAAAYAADAYAADAAAAYAADAGKQNQMQTADICRKYIGELIIEKCNELNTKEK